MQRRRGARSVVPQASKGAPGVSEAARRGRGGEGAGGAGEGEDLLSLRERNAGCAYGRQPRYFADRRRLAVAGACVEGEGCRSVHRAGEGEVEVLKSLGVTEEFCEAQIFSSMEVAEIGRTQRGVPVYMDRHASKADGVVVVNRIKAHTDCRGPAESGLLKMAAIGLGKHAAALELHGYGVTGIKDYMIEVGEEVLRSGRVLFGLGLVENAYDEPAKIEAIEPENVREREEELLREYMGYMPSLPVKEMDILFVDALGKNYSGTGMDTNIIGRFRILGVEEPESPNAKYIIVSRVSDESHGNTLGAGLADFTTERFFGAVDRAAMNANVMTSTFVERAKIPMVLENDKEALEAAIRCNWGVPPEETRMVRIPNTLHLEHVYLSENLVDEALENGNVELVGEAAEPEFDENGYLKHF